MPLIGVKSLNVPMLTEAEYIDLVDLTGREWHSGKRGRIEASEPRALRKLGLDKDHWTTRVKGIGSGYWREKMLPNSRMCCLSHSFRCSKDVLCTRHCRTATNAARSH